MGRLKKLFSKHQPLKKLPVHPEDMELIKDVDAKWWDQLTIEMIKKMDTQDNVQRLTFYNYFVEQEGFSKSEAITRLKEATPLYYGKLIDRTDDKLGYMGEDSKLPFILKGRIIKATTNGTINKSTTKPGISMNAIIRRLIREGQI